MMDGTIVNIDATTFGAIMAIDLMFMKVLSMNSLYN